IEKAAQNLGIPEVLVLPELPLDRRHHAKIDYPALFALLDKLFPRPGP
ncbi:MAG: hypothetical protein JWO82_1678, partial [Akkermansiaceae bacterium]|nr:hypothetical protein [Akkermansiaceae bacterium]